MAAIQRVRVEPLPLLSGPRIQLDDPVREVAVILPDVALGVEPRILAPPAAVEFRGVGELARSIAGEVVLDEHGLPQDLFVEGHLHIDPGHPRLRAGPEVLREIVQQDFPVLEAKAGPGVPEAEQSLGVAGGITVP